MKKSKVSVFLLISLISFGVFTFLIVEISQPQKEDFTVEMNSLALNDVEKQITVDTGPYDLAYLEGSLWYACITTTNLNRIDPNTGTTLSSINLGFNGEGLTTDGTYLYVSVYQNNNGTIFKYLPDGTKVTSVDVAIPLGSHILGLAWDGTGIWATFDLQNITRKYDPTTGTKLAEFDAGIEFAGITYHSGLLWCTDWRADVIRAVDTATGGILETITVGHAGSGDFGLANNGTTLFQGYWNNKTISFLDIPLTATFGDVYNCVDKSSISGDIADAAYNGTHYFISRYDTNSIYIIEDGSYVNVDNFSLSYSPHGMTVAGDYLVVADGDNSPYKIYKYFHQNGTYVSEYDSIPYYRKYGLAYDGTYLWISGHTSSKLFKVNFTDGTQIANYSLNNYLGLTYINGYLWALDRINGTINQIDLTGSFTGVNITIPTGIGVAYGLTYDGKHLVLTGNDDLYFCKFIVSTSTTSTPATIPGFELFFILLTMIAIAILTSFGRKFQSLNQKN